MPKLLVTGGCGFIGSNFVRHLLTSDPSATVVNFDCLTYAGNLANLADVAGHPRMNDSAHRTCHTRRVSRGRLARRQQWCHGDR